MDAAELVRDAVLRVGEVSAVEGRKIFILVDQNKNLSDMFLDGEILTNIAVNSYVEIRKGFLSIIGRVEGERIQSDGGVHDSEMAHLINSNKRVLTVALTGFIDEKGVFNGGTKELPLIGNEAYLLTRQRVHLLHNLTSADSLSINVATLFGEEIDIQFPVDGLFNSHIAIFGNTGSGKTNTLAALYQELIRSLQARNQELFVDRTRFLFIDFNGEYGGQSCLTTDKKVYNLSTRLQTGDKIPIEADALLDLEVLSILTDATEKTQKPFIRRALRLLNQIRNADNPLSYAKEILRKRVTDTLQIADKVRAFLLIDYFEQILPESHENGIVVEIDRDLEWFNTMNEFRTRDTAAFLRSNPDRIPETILYRRIEHFLLEEDPLANFIVALYVQLISDVIANRAQNEHVAPVINRLKGKRDDIQKLFTLDQIGSFWDNNVVIINLHDVNLEMKKTLPLLITKKIYADQKENGADRTLSIIIDEAHNILSRESSREAETWKDYRLETFEEIIKEGRKFGVFVTLASQRPSDISPTIVSQAHNYFIHRLVNNQDLKMIATAVSYIDRVTEESIPTLPTGTCIFSGVATQVPLKLQINPLDDEARPRSTTRKFCDVLPLQ